MDNYLPLVAAFSITALLLVLGSLAAAAGTRPKILFILIDDK